MSELIDAIAAVATDVRPWIMVGIIAAIIAFCAVTEKRSSKPFDPWEK